MSADVKPILRIAFRIDRSGKDKQVTAVLPDLEANGGRWVCYAHIDQHGECSHWWYYYQTKPATPEQYKDLLAELTGIYSDCTLRVVKRINLE